MLRNEVTCHHCGERILSRQTLAVGGRTLRPMHAGCYAAYSELQPWYRKPGWPANRWISFLPFNAILITVILLLYVIVPDRLETHWIGVAAICAVANAWLVVGRWLSYFSVERHVPKT